MLVEGLVVAKTLSGDKHISHYGNGYAKLSYCSASLQPSAYQIKLQEERLSDPINGSRKKNDSKLECGINTIIVSLTAVIVV